MSEAESKDLNETGVSEGATDQTPAPATTQAPAQKVVEIVVVPEETVLISERAEAPNNQACLRAD